MKRVDSSIRNSILKIVSNSCLYNNNYTVGVTDTFFTIGLSVKHSIVTNLRKLKHIKL